MTDGVGLPYASICSGIGLLDLAIEEAFGRAARPVVYCEREAFCCEFLAQAVADGRLAPAPICTDLRELRGDDLPHVELLAGGIPCQSYSNVGRRLRDKDERDLVDEFIRLASETGAPLLLVENVKAFIHPAGLGRLLRGMARLGLHAEWTVISAADIGAAHRRDRVFVLGYTDEAAERAARAADVAHADGERLGGDRGSELSSIYDAGPPLPGDLLGWQRVARFAPELLPYELEVRSLADGDPTPVDAIRSLGNAVHPTQAVSAIQELLTRARRR